MWCSRRACLVQAHPFTSIKTYRRQIATETNPNLRSKIWTPTAQSQTNPNENDTHALLLKGGYIRQAYSGVYHMLPLGLRVQTKLEALIDKHMKTLSASKVSLSSLTSQSLWKESGRWAQEGEFFRLKDRKNHEFFLAPTHEEEITNLMKSSIATPNQLPTRLYQVSRKYRDEKRPRGGLLRGREFLMKDLYTFDRSLEEAHATYDLVRQAYRNLFDELKLPYIEARASSGNMGGKLSHEYHFPSPLGEDDIITCSSCDVSLNEEFVPELQTTTLDPAALPDAGVVELKQSTSSFFAKPNTLIRVVTQQSDQHINPYVVKEALVDLPFSGVENPESMFMKLTQASPVDARIVHLFDSTFTPAQISQTVQQSQNHGAKIEIRQISSSSQRNILHKHKTGDKCESCAEGTLTVQKAVEVGHTFHLGDRYSSKFDFKVPTTEDLVQMGCHGIGVSRLIAAAASVLSSDKALAWPKAIAPYQVYIIPRNPADLTEATKLYHQLVSNGVDAIIDDSRDRSMGWKFKDAALFGSPVHVIIGQINGSTGKPAEIQCPRYGKLGNSEVPASQAWDVIKATLKDL